MNQVVLYVAAAMTGLWGVAHLFATRRVVAGFGDLTKDNRRIITMEWIIEASNQRRQSIAYSAGALPATAETCRYG